jgi:phosphatidylserine/phosphatidylglycerophosphate/cardiolipin synthase-like enzyme
MTTTTLVLIAVPGGSDPRRLSVVVLPRLSGAATLADFPNMLGWTQRLVDSGPTIDIDVAGQPWSATVETGHLRPDLWEALFQPELPVEEFVLEDHRGWSVRSTPTGTLVDLVEDVFGAIGLRSPGHPPTARELDEFLDINRDATAFAGDAHFERDRLSWSHLGMGVIDRELTERNLQEALATNPPSRQEALDRFYAMRVQGRAERSQRPWPGRPDPSETTRRLDVHGVLGALTHHPALLRALGLVIDLILPDGVPELEPTLPGGPFPTVVVRSWSLPVADREELVLPRSAVDPASFLPATTEFAHAAPRGGVASGAIALDPRLWSLVQIDVEGAVTKLLNLSERDPVGRADPAVAVGLPTLRSDGIGVASLLQASEAFLAFDRAARLDVAVRGGPNEVLTAAHLTHGYRVDISRGSRGPWLSLHQRHVAYDIDGLTWASDDEGFATAALAVPPTPARTFDAAEVVLRWTGWSLSAPRPYAPVGREVTANDPGTEPEGGPPPTSPLSMTSKPTPRSLPILRFGARYWIRLRAVDIGGGGIGPGFPGDLPALPAKPDGHRYLRFEPVPAPIIVTLADDQRLAPAEQRRPTLAIASQNVTPQTDASPTPETASAQLLPPKATVDLVERHGCLDDPSGRPRPAAEVHSLLADRDVPVDRITTTGHSTVLHLSDPLARGVALRGLPGVPDGWIGTVSADGTLQFAEKDPIPFPGAEAGVVTLRFDGPWPDLTPLHVRLVEGSSLPTWESLTGTLVVHLPKGRRTDVAVSTLLDPDDLSLLGVWEWFAKRLDLELANTAAMGDWSGSGRSLTDKLAKRASISRLALEGGHWALTPTALLRLEHRVTQPIGIPRLIRFADPFPHPAPDPGTAALDVSRTALSTTASLSGGLLVDLASTGSVTVRASWSDPLDDPALAGPTRVARDDVVGRIEVPEQVAIGDVLTSPGAACALVIAESALGWPGKDHLAGVKTNQDVHLIHAIGDTRHHLISYRAQAVSRDAAEQPDGTITTRVSEPAEIHVPASANPDAPLVAEVVPAFKWEREHTTDVRTSVRRARTIRVYLERSWFSSGDGELLGVACLPAAQTLVDRLCAYRDAVSLWGLDPLHAGGDLWPDAPRQWSFPEAVALGDDLRLPNLNHSVDVAGHNVHFDDTSERWFADIVLDAADAYTPFVRLVLVRYQPHALPDRELSSPVVVDHFQLSPDRAVTVATLPDDPHRRSVVVAGVAPTRPSTPVHGTPPSYRNEIHVSVERFVPELGLELGWDAAPAAVATVAGAMAPEPSQAVLWRGQITLADPSTTGLRLVVTEHERYRTDPTSPAEAVVQSRVPPTATRIVFVETIMLGEPVTASEAHEGGGPRRAFTAPLFANDTFLTSCLNAEATLGDRPSDLAPADSVRRYQSALIQLGLDIGPAGINGVWGADLYAASLAFKTALNLRSQDGGLDGYCGPRTLAAMEDIFGYARFDEAAAAVDPLDFGARTGEQTDLGNGVIIVPYEQGLVACFDWVTTRAVPAPLSDKWLSLGGPDGVIGRPTSDPFLLLNEVLAQQFDEAALIIAPDGTITTLPLAVLEELQTGFAGLPTADPAPLVVGSEVKSLPCSRGAVLWAVDTRALAVPQQIVQRWVADAEAGNPPGPPVSVAFAQPGDGIAFPFADGILALAATGTVDRLPGPATELDRYQLPPDPKRHLATAVDGADVRLLIGGNAFFASLADDLARVSPTGFVYLSSWNCEIDLPCFPAGRTLGDALTEATGKGAEVAMQLWAADPVSQAAGPLVLHPMVAIVLAVIDKANLKPNAHNRLAIAAVGRLPNSFAFVDSNHATFGSHHQKIVVIHTGTDLVAYLGGMEFTDDRLLSVSKGAPYFDVSVRIAGQGAKPILTTFAERWAAHPEGAAHPLQRATSPVLPISTGSVRVQVGHTYSAKFPFPQAISTASELTASAIEKSASYFYIEDQYFVGNQRLDAAIRSALARGIIGIAVIAAEDSVEDTPDVGFRRRAFINPILTIFPGKFLVFEAVGDDGTSTGAHAYVHSKLVLVDDEILVIGSMNSNRRSATHDSEVMATIVDQNGPTGIGPSSPGFAKAARIDIWSRHLKPTAIPAIPLPIEPLPAALLAWQTAAAGIPGLSVRPYPQPGTTPTRPRIGPGPASSPLINDLVLDTAWNTFIDPA